MDNDNIIMLMFVGSFALLFLITFLILKFNGFIYHKRKEKYLKLLNSIQIYVDYITNDEQLKERLKKQREYRDNLIDEIKLLKDMAKIHILYSDEQQAELRNKYQNYTNELEKICKEIESIKDAIDINYEYILAYARTIDNKKIKKALKFFYIE